jgi:O-antigen/teichoic acid export membrane protein
LQETEAQGFMVRWLFCAAVLNLLLDWFLIPPYGAIGAAIANGIAQSVAVGGVWAKGTAALRIKLPTRFLRRVTVSAALMSAIVLPIGALLPGLPALLVGVPTGVVAFGLMIRLFKCLETEDLARFRELSRRLPSRLWPTIDMVLRLLMPHGDEQRLEPAGAS